MYLWRIDMNGCGSSPHFRGEVDSDLFGRKTEGFLRGMVMLKHNEISNSELK